MSKIEDKYTSEMDIVTLVSRIRDRNAMLSGLLTKEQKKILKYTKDTVIDLS